MNDTSLHDNMTSTHRPIELFCQDSVSERDYETVVEGIGELVDMAGVDIPLYDLGAWRHAQAFEGGELQPYLSVDWYLAQGRSQSRRSGQLNAATILNQLYVDPLKRNSVYAQPHYDVMVVTDDLYDGTPHDNFIIGLARTGDASIISTHRFSGRHKQHCIKTEIMHELGHVFGLPSESRTHNVEESLGKHCTNRCIMRQGLRVPGDWVRLSRDRKRYGALCGECREDLYAYFQE